MNNKDLDFWIKHSKNVLLKGKHGVGKTTMVLEAFARHNLKWKYFSASTMDPWVDFIGIPKELTDEKGHKYLDLIRPKEFQDDEVEAIFIDEFNRSQPKVRNAVLELIQFKSINGRKFHNLKMVWAAINPDDDEEETYDVEKLDPAQMDRFHVIVTLPYKPCPKYFGGKYKNLGNLAIEWWQRLEKAQQKHISPRRLDYALDHHSQGGTLSHVLPLCVNSSELARLLSSEPFITQVKDIIKNKDIVKGQTLIQDENNYHQLLSVFDKDADTRKFFLPLLSNEKLTSYMTSKVVGTTAAVKKLRQEIIDLTSSTQNFKKRVLEVLNLSQNNNLCKSFYGTELDITPKTPQETGLFTTQQRTNAYDNIRLSVVQPQQGPVDDNNIITLTKQFRQLIMIAQSSQQLTIEKQMSDLATLISRYLNADTRNQEYENLKNLVRTNQRLMAKLGLK